MKIDIENEAQAVSEARKFLQSTDAANSDQRAVGLAQWVLAEYARKREAEEQSGPRRHLIVICDCYSDMTTWVGDLALPREAFRRLHVQHPGVNLNRCRGLCEEDIAFVRVTPRSLTDEECRDFGLYMALGSPEFMPGDRVLIRSWLGVKTPLHG